MTNIAFIGLGIMGSPMAVHLANAGHQVTEYNRSPEDRAAGRGRWPGRRIDPRGGPGRGRGRGDGAGLTGRPGSACREQRCVRAREDGLVIDFSSIRPDVTTELAAQAQESRLPLSGRAGVGGEAGAKNAALSIMVGGSAEDFEAARPVLDAVGRTVVHVGPNGAGQTVKAANQLIVAANIQVLAEAVVFLEAYGVDTKAALEVLGSGLAGSKVLEQKKANMLAREFEPGFRVELHHKDLGIVTSAAREAGVVIPLGALVAQLMASAKAAGDGGLDHSALLRGVERLSGRSQRS